MRGGGGGSDGVILSLSRTVMTTLLGTVLVLAMVAPTTQGMHAEDCRLYTVNSDQPSPTLNVTDSNSMTYISLDLLFDNSTASINISNGESSSCQITVSKANGTLHGDCFNPVEKDLLNFTQNEGMNTIILKRSSILLIVSIDGDPSHNKVLELKESNQDKGIQVQVNSDTIVNTAFNCPSKCFQFTNAIMHSKDNLTLYARQTSVGNGSDTPFINILHSEDWDDSTFITFTYPQKDDENMAVNSTYNQKDDQVDYENMASTTTYPQYGVQEDNHNVWKLFYAESNYTTDNDSVTSLKVSGSLIGKGVPPIVATVPTMDTYFKFENMDTVLWSTCNHNQVEASSDISLVTNNDVTTVEGETETTEEPTTKRQIEEMSCKDTWEPKCELTSDAGGSCNCAEAKEKGWCLNLDDHPSVKENCNRTCGLCPDQGVDARGGRAEDPTVSPAAAEGEVTTKPPGGDGMALFFVVVGVLVALLLVFLIWCLVKKKSNSGRMDLESQSQSHTITVQESTDKTEENHAETDKIKTQEHNDNKKGTENTAFQEQEEDKESNPLINKEKDNTSDSNKNTGENSSTTKDKDSLKDSNTSTSANGDAHDQDIEMATVKETNTKGEEEVVDNEEDGKANKDNDDESPHENTKTNLNIEKKDEPE